MRKQEEGHNDALKSPVAIQDRPTHGCLAKVALQCDLATALCITATRVEETDGAQKMVKVLIETLRGDMVTYDRKTSNRMGPLGSVPTLPDDLESLQLCELKDALEARGLDATGETPQLIARLREYEDSDASGDGSGGSSNGGDSGSEEQPDIELLNETIEDDADHINGSGADNDVATHARMKVLTAGTGTAPTDVAIVGLVLGPTLAKALSKVARQRQQEGEDGEAKRKRVALQVATALDQLSPN